MNLVLRVVIAILVLAGTRLVPLATPPVATASAFTTGSAPFPWGSATPTMLTSPLTGETHAVWVEQGEHTAIRHAAESVAGVWTSEMYPVAYGDKPDAEFSPDGMLHVVFEKFLFDNWEIYYVELPVGAERWKLPTPVSRTTGESRNPRMSVAPDGVIHTTWQDRTPGYWVVYKGWLCNANLMVFCNYPLENGRGFAPDVLADGQGQWIVWQDDAYGGEGNYTLMQFPNEKLATIVHDTGHPVSDLRLEHRFLPGGGVRVRWVDDDGVQWFCDAWLDSKTGEIQIGHVLSWPPEGESPTPTPTPTLNPPHKVLLPFAVR